MLINSKKNKGMSCNLFVEHCMRAAVHVVFGVSVAVGSVVSPFADGG